MASVLKPFILARISSSNDQDLLKTGLWKSEVTMRKILLLSSFLKCWTNHNWSRSWTPNWWQLDCKFPGRKISCSTQRRGEEFDLSTKFRGRRDQALEEEAEKELWWSELENDFLKGKQQWPIGTVVFPRGLKWFLQHLPRESLGKHPISPCSKPFVLPVTGIPASTLDDSSVGVQMNFWVSPSPSRASQKPTLLLWDWKDRQPQDEGPVLNSF